MDLLPSGSGAQNHFLHLLFWEDFCLPLMVADWLSPEAQLGQKAKLEYDTVIKSFSFPLFRFG